MGTIGGSIFHGIKGFRNAPSGYNRRLASSYTLIRQRATLTGSGFAAWGGMFSVVDCSLAYVRQKEDPWNSIACGFITGGLLQIRRKLALSLSLLLLNSLDRITTTKILLSHFRGSGCDVGRRSGWRPHSRPYRGRFARPLTHLWPNGSQWTKYKL